MPHLSEDNGGGREALKERAGPIPVEAPRAPIASLEEAGGLTALRARASAPPVSVQPDDTFATLFSDFGRGMLRFVTDLLGMPVDIANFALGVGGLPVSPKPLGGAESLRELARGEVTAEPFLKPGVTVAEAAGGPLPPLLPSEELPTPGRRIAGRIGEEVGAGATILFPFLKAAAAFRPGFGLTLKEEAPLVGPALRFAERKPAQAAAGEVTAAAGGGLGAGLAREAFPTEDPLARTGIELAGALPGSVAATSAFALPQVGIRLARIAETTLLPFLPSTQRRIAAEIVADRVTGEPRKVAETLDAAIKAVERELPAAEVTPARLAENQGLLALERDVIAGNAELALPSEQAAQATATAIRAAVQDNLAGRGVVTTEFLEGRINRLTDLLGQRTNNAALKAKEKIEALAPEIDEFEASRIVKAELEAAELAAEDTVTTLWSKVSKTRLAPTEPIQRWWEGKLGALGKFQNEDDIMPKRIRDELAKLDVQERVGELVGAGSLRSLVLDEMRRQRALITQGAKGASAIIIKNFGELQEQILKSLNALANELAVESAVRPLARDVIEGNKIRAALDFTRLVKDTFSRGPIGRVLGFGPKGAPKVTAEATLNELLKPGVAGKEGSEALLATQLGPFGGRPALVAASRQFMIKSFFDQATDRTGQIIDSKAQTFLKKYSASLDKFPELKAQIADAAEAQRLADTFARSQGRLTKSILDQRRSAAALFLARDPDKTMARLFASNRPVNVMRELVKQTGKDPSGEALAGLKQMFYEHALVKVEGTAGPLGASMETFFLKNKLVRRVMAEIYTPDEIKRLGIIVKWAKIADARVAGAAGQVVPPMKSIILDTMARIGGARTGAQFGGATGAVLIAAASGSRAFRTVLQKFLSGPIDNIKALVEQAVFDPEVMKTMLMQITPKTEPIIIRRLRGHLANLGIKGVESVFEDYEQAGLVPPGEARAAPPRPSPIQPQGVRLQGARP